MGEEYPAENVQPRRRRIRIRISSWSIQRFLVMLLTIAGIFAAWAVGMYFMWLVFYSHSIYVGK